MQNAADENLIILEKFNLENLFHLSRHPDTTKNVEIN